MIIITYRTPRNGLPTAQQVSNMQNVVLNRGEMTALYDVAFSGDSTAAFPSEIIRSISLVEGPQCLINFPTIEDRKNAFRNLYQSTLNIALNAPVYADEPFVS